MATEKELLEACHKLERIEDYLVSKDLVVDSDYTAVQIVNNAAMMVGAEHNLAFYGHKGGFWLQYAAEHGRS